jgi:hypothetical protein
MTGQPAYAFYGHHKCATMWLNTIASSVCRRLGLKFRAVYDEDGFGRDLEAFVTRHDIDFLAYGNADIAFVRRLPPHRGFHIVRDPRDVAVSAYFSHLKSHATEGWPELIAHRRRLKELSKDEGLALEIRFREREFRHMATWDYDQPQILEVRFEDLTRASYDVLLRIFDFLDLLEQCDYRWPLRARMLIVELLARIAATGGRPLPRPLAARRLPAPELLTIAWRRRFEAQSGGRSPGEENTAAHYRKGRAGDWINHFTADHKRLFKDLYPDLVPSLGYADADDW